jgi:hypothetical protein
MAAGRVEPPGCDPATPEFFGQFLGDIGGLARNHFLPPQSIVRVGPIPE